MYTFITTPGIEKIITGQIYPGVRTKIDTELALHRHLLGGIESGEKTTTVRYGRDRIRVPAGPELPLFLTSPSPWLTADKEPHGTIRIPRFTVKRFGELTDNDARRDGYATLAELKDAIRRIYEPLYNAPVLDDEWVSIYELKL